MKVTIRVKYNEGRGFEDAEVTSLMFTVKLGRGKLNSTVRLKKKKKNIIQFEYLLGRLN